MVEPPEHLIEVSIAPVSRESGSAVRRYLTALAQTNSPVRFKVDGPSGNVILGVQSEPHLQSILAQIETDLKITMTQGTPRICYRSGPSIEGGQAQLLEPVMNIEITTPACHVADLLMDLSRRRGRVADEKRAGDDTIIRGLVPLSSLFGYGDMLKNVSTNAAHFTLRFSHYGPAALTTLSRLGVSFTTESVISMRRFASGLPLNPHYVLVWEIQRDPHGQLRIGLGADPASKHPTASEIEDHIDGVPFYWLAKADAFNLLRAAYCVDYEVGKRSCLIPLSTRDNN